MYFGFSDPENPILDTKTTSVRSIVREKNELVGFVGHLERHLEYLKTARVCEVTQAASDSTLKQLTLAGYQIGLLILYFTIIFLNRFFGRD